ncbi:MAG TPA: tetratricopeptide repeat protein [Bryobacteraceae bacterium]|nr:tetratricopeptide repeat protein [Bryobacteraceae bacterium]
MYRFVYAGLLAVVFLLRANGQDTGQLDASPTLFTVMAAINAAGYDADLDSPNGHPLRKAIRAEIAKRDIPSLPALEEFFQKHRRRTDTAELSQYISFGLTAGGPPGFAITRRGAEIPPDVGALNGLSPLLAAFYKEAGLEDLWKRSQRAIDQYIAHYHGPVIDAVMQVNTYLRQQTSGLTGRRFQIFIELQAAPNQVQRRSYGFEDFMVITPSPEPRIFDVRHGYLHYLLDPLAIRHQEILDRKKGLADHAQRAQALDDSFKNDFVQLATESLIKAVEARLDHRPGDVQQALLQGFILTPFFSERLPVYEKQEASMQVYYPDLAGAIDLMKEERRLAGVEFAREAAPAHVVRSAQPAAPPPPPLTGAAKTLNDADNLYAARELEKAKKLYLDALQQTDQEPVHAAVYYGLARIATLEKDPETAERLFQKVLELQPEAPVHAWALVYLGKLALAAGEREPAAKYFQDALKVEGASEKARQEAQQGIQQSSRQ